MSIFQALNQRIEESNLVSKSTPMKVRNNLFLISLYIIIIASCTSPEFQEYSEVTIYRDEWGVPHIHAATDEQAAYGLAWASCEDDFITIQEQMMAIKGKYGEHKGKEGLVADFAIHFMGIRSYAKENYKTALSPKVLKIVQSYADGVNAFAQKYPDEVLLSSVFPVVPEDLIAGYMLGLVEISGAGEDLQKIMNGKIINDMKSNFPKGSNAIAINGKKSVGEETFLAINSHQPLEGWYSWYEAHLISDEGTNILGGTFPGGATIFHGTNQYLGWAHTVNHADFSDVYKLEINPDDEMQYLVDGQWYSLEKRSIWAWMKIWGPIKVPVRQTIYQSIYGSTFKTDDGVFAWNYAAGKALKSIEQWYHMNRAEGIDDFREALNMQGIPCTNIVYADAEQNIMYISNANIPLRDKSLNWREVIPGTSLKTLLKDTIYPIDSLPQVFNPASGFVYNTNNTPYSSSDSLNNPKPTAFNSIAGFFEPEHQNNRSLRFLELIYQMDSLGYDDFKRVKFDRQYPQQLRQAHMMNQELLLQLDSDEFKEIEDAILLLNSWNRRSDEDNTTAPLFLLSLNYLNELLKEENLHKRGNYITAMQCAEAISKAKAELLNTYGIINPPLSAVMRHKRGEVDMPIGGGSDVLAAIYGARQEDGTYRATAGESYIQLVRFRKGELPLIETVNAFGTSAEPDSPHYTDQMDLFVKQKLKPMSLSLDAIKNNHSAEYHPLKMK